MRPARIPPIHSDGYIFSFLAAVITLVLFHVLPILGYIGSVITLWVLYFFRNPDRVTPTGENLIISPADGTILTIAPCVPPSEMSLGKSKMIKISIFMDVFNVHVNRIPIDGKVIHKNYHKGAFLNASLDKASEKNERLSLVVETPSKEKVGFTQIAGLIARRIRCDVKEEQAVTVGSRYGLIRFGSRVDLYLPQSASIKVLEGQTTVAGETIMAALDGKKESIEGEIR